MPLSWADVVMAPSPSESGRSMYTDGELEHEAAIRAEGHGLPPGLGDPESDANGSDAGADDSEVGYDQRFHDAARSRAGAAAPTRTRGQFNDLLSRGAPRQPVVSGVGITPDGARDMERLAAQQQRARSSAAAGPSDLDNGGGVGLPYGAARGGATMPDDDDARSTDAASDVATDEAYPGFDPKQLRADGEAKPLIRPRSDLWVPITNGQPDSQGLGVEELLPKRAMCFNIIAPFFRRDAEFFWQWQLPKGQESRAQAAAALCSMLFAGTAMGIPSGRHEENDRQQAEEQAAAQADAPGGGGGAAGGAGAKAKSKPLSRVTRYTYVPSDRDSDSHPMFQIGIEEIYDQDQSEVLALRVWLFVHDERHSTSHLLSQVMKEARALHDSARGSAQLSALRSKTACAEQARHDKSGCGFGDLRANFERTAGMQWTAIKTIDDWLRMLQLHSGQTSHGAGRPCVANIAQHMHCAAGRRVFEGDTRTGCGGRHPASPEYLLNAKRDEALAFGLVDLDGIPLNVCDEQLDPANYWAQSGHFKSPKTNRTTFWVYNSVETKTPFDMHLMRPLSGTVLPGPALMELYAEEELRKEYAGRNEEPTDEELSDATEHIDPNLQNKLRSLMTKRDEHQRAMDALLRNSIASYDLMQSASGPGGNGGLDVSFNDRPDSDAGEAMFTLRTVPMTKKVATETDRLWTKVVQPWISRMEYTLADMQSRLLEGDRRDELAQEREEREHKRRSAHEASEEERWAAHVEAGGGEDDFYHMEDVPEEGEEGEEDEERDEGMDVDQEGPREDETWERYDELMAAYKKRLYNVKSDVVKYHCRLIKSCFLSTRDAATLPAGYKVRTDFRTSTHLTHSQLPTSTTPPCAGNVLVARARHQGARRQGERGVARRGAAAPAARPADVGCLPGLAAPDLRRGLQDPGARPAPYGATPPRLA